MQPSGIITLLTDFGQQDAFVGTMKGVILGIHPAAKIVDLTHDIPPQNLSAGAFNLRNAFRFFPEGTVHVVVVDPGVGSGRRIIGMEAGGHYFVAPDNGVLKYIFAEGTVSRVVSITNNDYFVKPVSQTFHGRDIFAPTAAHLAKGLSLENLGPVISDYQTGSVPQVQREQNILKGEIIYVDRFGNLISNISENDLSGKDRETIQVTIANTEIKGLHDSYAGAQSEHPIALIGSSGYLEVAVNLANASRILGCSEGEAITLTLN